MNTTLKNKLRILWITNNPLPLFAKMLGVSQAISGGWLIALADELVKSGKVYLGVVSNVVGAEWTHKKLGGIENYAIPISRRRKIRLRPTKAMVIDYKRVVEEFNPDVIHIHGTENYFGLLSAEGHLDRPTVISIQGIIDFHRRHFFDGMPVLDILKTRTLRDWLLFDGLFEQKIRWNRQSAIERRIFAGNSAFIGRTLWTQAHLRRLNPEAHYYHGDEMLRPIFYSSRWIPENIRRFSIFAPSASYPIKGFHVLIKAMAILRREFPEIKVRVPLAYFKTPAGIRGWYTKARRTGYANYLDRLIRANDLIDYIEPLGPLSAEQMVGEYMRAHVFVLPSLIENSPNSLAEAMMIGTPSVVSFVGGVPSMMTNGVESLAFPSGDEAVLAEQIRRIFCDDKLASDLSVNAHNRALERYSPDNIINQMVRIYHDVMHKECSQKK
jgi:glycosyltransferase involved in cell wall biosynthesis